MGFRKILRGIQAERYVFNRIVSGQSRRFFTEHGSGDADDVEINSAQRVFLIAEDFHYEVLASAEWLNEMFGVDIECYKIMLLTNETGNFLALTKVYPVTPIEEAAVQRQRVKDSARRRTYKDWESALSRIENAALIDFYKSELALGVDSYLGNKRQLTYRIGRKGKLSVHAHQKHAYVWQYGRFDGDINFGIHILGSTPM